MSDNRSLRQVISIVSCCVSFERFAFKNSNLSVARRKNMTCNGLNNADKILMISAANEILSASISLKASDVAPIVTINAATMACFVGLLLVKMGVSRTNHMISVALSNTCKSTDVNLIPMFVNTMLNEKNSAGGNKYLHFNKKWASQNKCLEYRHGDIFV